MNARDDRTQIRPHKPACDGLSRLNTVKTLQSIVWTLYFSNKTWIFVNSLFTAGWSSPTFAHTSLTTGRTSEKPYSIYQGNNGQMVVLRSSTILFYIHVFTNHIPTICVTFTMIHPAIQKPTAKIHVSIESNLLSGYIFKILHTWTSVWTARLLDRWISICSTMKLLNCHRYFVSRCLKYCGGESSTTQPDVLSTSFSGTLRWQPSQISLRSTFYRNSCRKYPTPWASTMGHRAMCVTIIWRIQTTFRMMIKQVSLTANELNGICSLGDSLRSANIRCILQQRNSTILRNISTEKCNFMIGGDMNRYNSWVSW